MPNAANGHDNLATWYALTNSGDCENDFQGCIKNFLPRFRQSYGRQLHPCTQLAYPTIYIIRVTLIRLFDTFWLLQRIVKSTGSDLTNGTLADEGGLSINLSRVSFQSIAACTGSNQIQLTAF